MAAIWFGKSCCIWFGMCFIAAIWFLPWETNISFLSCHFCFIKKITFFSEQFSSHKRMKKEHYFSSQICCAYSFFVKEKLCWNLTSFSSRMVHLPDCIMVFSSVSPSHFILFKTRSFEHIIAFGNSRIFPQISSLYYSGRRRKYIPFFRKLNIFENCF